MLINFLKRLLLASVLAVTATANAETDVNNAADFTTEIEKVVLSEDNLVTLRGPVTGESVALLALEVMKVEGKDVNLYISSPGGSVIAGAQLISILKGTGKRFNCVASVAASMAFIIFQACDTRSITESSILMQHVASYGVEGQAPNNVSRVAWIERITKSLDEKQAARIGMTFEDFRKKTRDDWWLFGEEALEQKVADKMVRATCPAELAKKTVTQVVTVFIFRVRVTFSKCPLIEAPLKVELEENSPQTKFETPAERKAYLKMLEDFSPRDVLMKRFLKANASK